MRMRQGYGYLASDKIEVSTANQEIIPNPPTGWTMGYRVYKLSLKIYDDTNIIINGTTNSFFEAGESFEVELGDPEIHSLVIVNEGVRYRWVGVY